MHINHAERLERARLSLEGLSVADALGGFFEGSSAARVSDFVKNRRPPGGEWHYTDDTNMALSIYQILRQHGEIPQDELAASFAEHFDRKRGYGLGARKLLIEISAGKPWRRASQELFGGGSFGNGGAMRVAPLGAYFADDLNEVVRQAALSAEITHAHPEGIAGAIAVAIAAAYAWRTRDNQPSRREFIDLVLSYIPESEVKVGCIKVCDLPDGLPIWPDVVGAIGNGSGVTAQDTVPFVLWSAGGNLGNYEEAFWQTATGGGDVDTNCAMVGGIVALSAGRESIPPAWITSREALPGWALGEV